MSGGAPGTFWMGVVGPLLGIEPSQGLRARRVHRGPLGAVPASAPGGAARHQGC